MQSLVDLILRRQDAWNAMRKETDHIGEQLTPYYSFRHRYAKAMHAAGFPIANIAEAMVCRIAVSTSALSKTRRGLPLLLLYRDAHWQGLLDSQ